MKLLQAAVYWLIGGSLVFLMWADYEKPVWNNLYFVWDSSRDLLFVIAAYYLIPENQRSFLKPAIVYCSIRVLWEILNLLGIGIKDETVVNIGFLALSVGVALLLIKDLKDRWTRNS